MGGWRTVANLLAAGLFAVAAAVQWNDPDAAPWIGFYALAGLISAVSAFRRLPQVVPGIAAIAAAVWLAWTVPAAVRSGDPNSEPSREAGGQLVVTVWMAGLAAFPGRSTETRPEDGER